MAIRKIYLYGFLLLIKIVRQIFKTYKILVPLFLGTKIKVYIKITFTNNIKMKSMFLSYRVLGIYMMKLRYIFILPQYYISSIEFVWFFWIESVWRNLINHATLESLHASSIARHRSIIKNNNAKRWQTRVSYVIISHTSWSV